MNTAIIPSFGGIGNLLLKRNMFTTLKEHGFNIVMVFKDKSTFTVAKLFFPWVKSVNIENSDNALNGNQAEIALVSFDSVEFKWILRNKKLSKKWILHKLPGRKAKDKVISMIFKLNGFHKCSCHAKTHEIELNNKLIRSYFENDVIIRNYQNEDVLGTILNHHNKDLDKLLEEPYMIISYGGANGLDTAKVINPNIWEKVCNLFYEKFREYKIFMVGDRGDFKKYNVNSLNLPKNVKIWDPRKYNLLDTIAAVAKSSFIISHDSGLMHIADVLGKPLVALYGPTDFDRTRPTGNKSRFIIANNKFTNYFSGFNNNEKDIIMKSQPYEAMSGISVRQIIDTSAEFIG